MNKETKKLLVISALIWGIANFHHPVTPTHFTNLNMPNHIFGTSYALMVLGMSITSSIWGSIGDRGYRIEVLSFVMFAYGIIQIIFGRITSISGIVIARVAGGMVASGFHVGLMSALVDVNSKEDRGKIMTTYSAVMSVSQAAGFLIGGVIGYLPTQWVFLIQGLSMITVSLIVILFINKTNAEKKGEKAKEIKFIWNILSEAKESEELFTRWIKVFLGMTFFVGIAYSGYNNAFNYYLKAELGMKPIINGIWKSLVGIVGLIANLTINLWLIRNTDTKKSIVGLLAMSTVASFLVYFNSNLLLFFIFSFIFFTLYTIQVPILQGFAVEDSVEDVGFMSGIFNASKSLGEMVGSSTAGLSYEISSKAPFLIGAIACLSAFILSLYNQFKEIKN